MQDLALAFGLLLAFQDLTPKYSKIPEELSAFRLLAKSYARVTEEQVRQLITQQYWIEICHDHQS